MHEMETIDFPNDELARELLDDILSLHDEDGKYKSMDITKFAMVVHVTSLFMFEKLGIRMKDVINMDDAANN